MHKWLNKKVRYTINGYAGVVTAHAVYATGEEKLLVESIDATGRPIEWWIDVRQADIIG